MSPEIPITDGRFQYTPAAQTDLKKTFAKVRKRLEAQKQAGNVEPLKRIAKK